MLDGVMVVFMVTVRLWDPKLGCLDWIACVLI